VKAALTSIGVAIVLLWLIAPTQTTSMVTSVVNMFTHKVQQVDQQSTTTPQKKP
jgi:hypothetical protein